MTFINQWFVTSCIGARAVRGRSWASDGGSDTWDIEIPAFDEASLYQTMVTEALAPSHIANFPHSRTFDEIAASASRARVLFCVWA
jgi:hypothetical protein